MTLDTDTLAWDKMDGLLPAMVQDADSGQLLMLGYMNRAALEKTIASGLVTFFSRSRKGLWTKGETSGNHLRLKTIQTDCDQDALLVQANPAGPTCHEGTVSCFGDDTPYRLGFLSQLGRLIETRRNADAADSYTARLLQEGRKRIAQKVGEEGVETALAGALGDRDELLNEAADLIYHLQVLLASNDADLGDVAQVLRLRHE